MVSCSCGKCGLDGVGKMRDSIRSVKTMNWLANLYTCVTTWKVRGIDYAAQMERYI